MAKYRPGEVVDIVAGTYKKYKTATFQRKAGMTMARITVHGIEETRNVSWSSIKKRAVNVDVDVVDTKQVLETTLADIKSITTKLKTLELNVKEALDKLD